MEKPILSACSALALLLLPAISMACTWFEFENNQKHAFIGRTMELPGDLQNRVYYFRAYNNYDIRKIELADIDFAETEFTSDTLYTPSKYEQFEFN